MYYRGHPRLPCEHRNSGNYHLKRIADNWVRTQPNQQNDLYAQQRLRSAWASAQSNQESLLCAIWVAKVPNLLQADTEYSDETVPMPWLIWVFAEHTGHFVGSVMLCLSLCKKPLSYRIGPEYKSAHHDKTYLCHIQTTKLQFSQHIHTVWSEPLLFAVNTDSCYV